MGRQKLYRKARPPCCTGAGRLYTPGAGYCRKKTRKVGTRASRPLRTGAGLQKRLGAGREAIKRWKAVPRTRRARSTSSQPPAQGLFEEVLELFAAGGVAELAQGLGFDLADALPGNVELPAHLLQGAGLAVVQAEA